MGAMEAGLLPLPSTNYAFHYGLCWHQTMTRYAILPGHDSDFFGSVSKRMLHPDVYVSAHFCIAAVQKRPAGDSDYCNRTRGRSPKDTRWDFDDDTV